MLLSHLKEPFIVLSLLQGTKTKLLEEIPKSLTVFYDSYRSDTYSRRSGSLRDAQQNQAKSGRRRNGQDSEFISLILCARLKLESLYVHIHVS